jgi:muramidase (phage lysozyme)
MLASAEGTSNHPATAMDGYDVIVTGSDRKPEVFKDFSDHPFARGRKSKIINSKGVTSNASGRYQQMLKDWPRNEHHNVNLNCVFRSTKMYRLKSCLCQPEGHVPCSIRLGRTRSNGWG